MAADPGPPSATSSSVQIKLERVDRTYVPGDVVRGSVVIRTHHATMAYSSVCLAVEGGTKLHLNARNVGLLEAFYSTIEPQVFFSKQVPVASSGVAARGETAIPFEFVLEPSRHQPARVGASLWGSPTKDSPPQQFCDTYHGVYINTDYIIRVEVRRGLLSTVLASELEFIVHVPGAGPVPEEPAEVDQTDDQASETSSGCSKEAATRDASTAASSRTSTPLSAQSRHRATHFLIAPETLENVSSEDELERIPRFKVHGKLHRLVCSITEPLTGELTVEEAAVPVASLDLQLVRIETVAYSEGVAQEATEVQMLQIGDGDVCRGLAIPIFLVLPRLFTCPTLRTETFRVDFELNLIISFQDGTVITESFPLELYRPAASSTSFAQELPRPLAKAC